MHKNAIYTSKLSKSHQPLSFTSDSRLILCNICHAILWATYIPPNLCPLSTFNPSQRLPCHELTGSSRLEPLLSGLVQLFEAIADN